MAKGLTRPITRKQALSYRRLRPNGLGVTAIAAVNGRKKKRKAKSPAKRRKTVCFQAKKNYRYTVAGARDELKHLKRKRQFSPRELASLRRDGKVKRGKQTFYSPYLVGLHRQELVAKKRAAAARTRVRANRHAPDYERRPRKTRSMLGGAFRNGRGARIAGMPVVSVGDDQPYVMQRYPLVHVPKSTRRRRARRSHIEETVMKRKRKSTKRSLAAKKAARTRAKKHEARVAAGKKAARTRKRRHGHKAAAPKRRRVKAARRRTTHRRKGKRYHRNEGAAAPVVAKPNRRRKGRKKATARRYRPITARVGGAKLRTYMYKSKRGVKHIPLYALAGAKSPAQFRAATTPGHKKAHTKAAARVRARVAAIMRARGKGVSRRVASIFTPNRGTVIPFAAWSKSMRPNRRRKKAAKKSVRRSRRAAPRRRRKAVRGTVHRKRRRTHRRKKAAAPRRRRRYAKNARRHHARRRHHAAGTHRRRRRYGRNRRRASYLPLRVSRLTYRSNKRRHRRGYRRNARAHAAHGFRAGDFMSQFVAALKVGLVAAGGMVAHRALSMGLSNMLSKQTAFQSGALATYRDPISQVIVAALGMFGLAKVNESVKQPWVAQVNAGVFVSLAHGLLSILVSKSAPQYQAYLAGYADNSSRAYSGFGEYMATNGFGEYMATNGFGAAPMLSQAAAGFGAPMLSQAAAGFGAPMLSQAAAGTGEYVASGVQGIGDYEMVNGTGSFGVEEDGIAPNLHSAEHALNIAEAAAGVAIGDLPPQSQQWPMMVAKPISDTMTGARAGTFQGRDGIFG